MQDARNAESAEAASKLWNGMDSIAGPGESVAANAVSAGMAGGLQAGSKRTRRGRPAAREADCFGQKHLLMFGDFKQELAIYSYEFFITPSRRRVSTTEHLLPPPI